MARKRWDDLDPLTKYGSRYHPHRMTPMGVREWTSARLRRHPFAIVERRLKEQLRRSQDDLASMRTLTQTAKVHEAVSNLEDHRKWLKLVLAALRRQANQAKVNSPRPAPTRVGWLAREAAAYKARKR